MKSNYRKKIKEEKSVRDENASVNIEKIERSIKSVKAYKEFVDDNSNQMKNENATEVKTPKFRKKVMVATGEKKGWRENQQGVKSNLAIRLGKAPVVSIATMTESMMVNRAGTRGGVKKG